MAKTGGGNRGGGTRGSKASGGGYATADLQSVKNALLKYARVDHWNDNSSVWMEDEVRGLIDSVSESPKLGFASQVAQSVRKYNYKISEKQAYVIAKAATEGKIGRLYNPDKTIRIVFRKWNPKTKKLE